MRASPRIALAAFVVLATLGVVSSAEPATWQIDDPGLGTWETCDTCDLCLLDEVPVGVDAPKPKPSTDGNVHCTKCLGCNVVLSRLDGILKAKTLEVDIRMSTGRSGAAILAGKTKESGLIKNVIVKMHCGVPGGYKQYPSLGATPEKCKDESLDFKCTAKSGTIGYGRCNYDFLSALDQIAVDANLSHVVGRSWTTELKSFLPKHAETLSEQAKKDPHIAKIEAFDDGSGCTKLNSVKAQMFERAVGIPLVELYSGGARLTEDVWQLTKKVTHQSIFAASFWDFLLGETDRHGENVLLDDSSVSVDGSGEAVIRLIDNDGALAVGDGGKIDSISSFLVPGTKWWRVLRNVRYGHQRMCCLGGIFDKALQETAEAKEALRNKRDPGQQDKLDACGVLGDTELLGPESLFDLRCHVPGRFVGTRVPSVKTEQWLRSVVKNTTLEVMHQYPGLIDPKRVYALKRRAKDYLDGGYEYALLREFARAKMLDCREDDGDSIKGDTTGKQSDTSNTDTYSSDELSPFRWRLNDPCCSLKADASSNGCNPIRVAQGTSEPSGDETDYFSIFPDNGKSDEYKRLYQTPVEVNSPRRSVEETDLVGE